jgi:restriction system protein
MDPIDFEDLVAALFKAMGMEVMTTERSGDGGVDVRAMDPTRSAAASSSSRSSDTAARSPRPPSATCTALCSTKAPPRESWVTTAEFGPSAQEFAAGKPLTLIGGKQLTDLLAHYGIR